MAIVRQRPETAKGMFFMTLEDEQGFANVVATPDVFARCRRVARSALFVLVSGVVERTGQVVNVKAEGFREIGLGSREASCASSWRWSASPPATSIDSSTTPASPTTTPRREHTSPAPRRHERKRAHQPDARVANWPPGQNPEPRVRGAGARARGDHEPRATGHNRRCGPRRLVEGRSHQRPRRITVFTELLAHIGRGEAACIAIAAKEGWHIASDEKRRFLREAEARVGVGHVITTVDVFVLAIKAGLLTVEEADVDKITLEGRRFKVSFASYRELVK
jgi:hypothetical protein